MVKRIAAAMLLLLIVSSFALAQGKVQRIAVVGNYTITDAAIIEIAEIQVGDQWSQQLQEKAIRNLKRSRRFSEVELKVRRRGSSISSSMVIIIQVQETEEVYEKLMVAPLFDYEEGYGFSYGAQLAADEIVGFGDFFTFPLQWGAKKKIGLGLQFRQSPLLENFTVRYQWSEKENPFYELEDSRNRFEIEKAFKLGPALFDATFAYTTVDFVVEESFTQFGLVVSYDSRQNIMLPHDSIFLRGRIDFFSSDDWEDGFTNTILEARAYKRIFGELMFAASAKFDLADTYRPDYLKPLLGGAESLRGHMAGAYVGDNVFFGTTEIRYTFLPTEIPAKIGVALFWDFGKAWFNETKFDDVDLQNGYGVSAYVLAMGYGIRTDVARNPDGDWRWHLSTSMKF